MIGADGAQLGIMTVDEACQSAERQGLDLVEVSPKAIPPVCRIMDYGKFRYELAKKSRATRAHTAAVQIKEIKFRPKTDAHDMEFKMRHIRRFLGEGHKVRLAVAFRGREMTHQNIGRALLDRIFKQLSDISVIEQTPSMDAKRMIMIIGPKVGVVQRAPGTVTVPTDMSSAGAPPTGPVISMARISRPGTVTR